MNARFVLVLTLDLLLLLAARPAAAAPPSSVLTGEEGTLSWTVTPGDGDIAIVGRSPKWSVEHVATPGLLPRSTVRSTPDGERVTVTYTASGATVALPGRTVTIDEPGLWDGDTLDVRLGALVAAGTTSVDFRALDVANAKVYSFQARVVGAERCGAIECTRVKVTLTGLLKAVGPKWHFWFGPDGRLLRFDGPIGRYAAEGVER